MPTVQVYIPERVYRTWQDWLAAWREQLGDPSTTPGEVLTGVVKDRKFWPRDKAPKKVAE